MRTCPLYSCGLGCGATLEVAPQPVMVRIWPVVGRCVFSGSGATSVTGADRRASARSAPLGACRTSTTSRVSPGEVVVLTVLRVAVVRDGVAPPPRTPLTSWKQWPAVTIQVREISAAVQPLL